MIRYLLIQSMSPLVGTRLQQPQCLQPPSATLQQTAVACITDIMHHISAVSGAINDAAAQKQPMRITLTQHQCCCQQANSSTVQQTNTAQLADPRCAHVCTDGKRLQ